ncbi:MAG: hypothetical protein FOGNACKC_06270 [Anaerolineae bacterium]|nr:hypothetical protein [Anaerolineae bacterium]
MLVTVSGKGGVGKTTLTALLVDELLRKQYPGRLLVVDADPAQTLHFALGIPAPGATLAQVRDNTPLTAGALKALPPGVTPAEYVRHRLAAAGVVVDRMLRKRPFDVLAMGHREGGPGCYCAINSALSEALATLMTSYDLIIVDSEAGIEHLSRYRIRQVDLFLAVTTPGRAARAVTRQIIARAREVGMRLGEVGVIVNRSLTGVGIDDLLAVVPNCPQLTHYDLSGRAVVDLPADAVSRQTLQIVIERIEALSDVPDLVPQA